MPQSPDERTVYQFILDEIESVPHLEALLLVWNTRPARWSSDGMAKRLFVNPAAAERILQDLARQNLIVAIAGATREYSYEPDPEKDRLLAAVDATYRKELVRVSMAIHSKGSAAVREFARAFRLKKE